MRGPTGREVQRFPAYEIHPLGRSALRHLGCSNDGQRILFSLQVATMYNGFCKKWGIIRNIAEHDIFSQLGWSVHLIRGVIGHNDGPRLDQTSGHVCHALGSSQLVWMRWCGTNLFSCHCSFGNSLILYIASAQPLVVLPQGSRAGISVIFFFQITGCLLFACETSFVGGYSFIISLLV